MEIILGILSISVALVVFLTPDHSMRTLVSLLSFSVVFYAIRLVIEGGVVKFPPAYRVAGVVGGVFIGAIALINVDDPGLRFATLVPLLASALAINGINSLANSLNPERPKWSRASVFIVGAMTLVLSGIALAFPELSRITLVGILTITIVINGVESIISGIRPSSPKQIALIKLVAFAIFYGFLVVNWIDLYGSGAPGYHIWLILTYLAPFDVLLVFQGLKDWQLALSLGLIVSLVNDLDYYITGNLFFGFHVNLIAWLAGQLGLEGSKVLFNFEGGFFTIPVTSYLMGFTIYARFVVVALILYQWWKSPWKLKA